MANNGSFKRVLVSTLQQIASTEPVRHGQYSSFALQEMMRLLLMNGALVGRTGFFGDGFKVTAGGAGIDAVDVAPGLGFQYDATGLGSDESGYRVMNLDAVVQVPGAHPGVGTFYVHAKWGSADGQSEVRQVRPAPGAAFAGAAVNTAHIPAATILWSSNASEAGYTRLATVVTGVGDSTTWTITDDRVRLDTVTRYKTIPLMGAVAQVTGGAGSWDPPTAARGWWLAAASTTKSLSVDVPMVYGDELAANRGGTVYVYVALAAGGDDGALYVDKVSGASQTNLVTVASIAAVIGAAPSGGWVPLALAGAYTHTDNMILRITPNTGGAGGLSVNSAYLVVNGRYMGPG